MEMQAEISSISQRYVSVNTIKSFIINNSRLKLIIAVFSFNIVNPVELIHVSKIVYI